jgi:hypothetical protein
MTRFRQALLDELMARVPDPVTPPAPRRPSRRLALAGAGGLAALMVVVTLIVTLRDTVPAYALSPDTDGYFTLTFNEFADPAGINRALRDAGIRVRVMLPEPAAACPPSRRGDRAAAASSVDLQAMLELLEDGISVNDGMNVARIQPDSIPADTIVVFTPSDDGHSLAVRVYRQPGPSCVVKDPTP